MVRLAPVSRFFTVTEAPGTVLPEESVTVPVRVAEICANDRGARIKKKAMSRAMGQRRQHPYESLVDRDVAEIGAGADLITSTKIAASPPRQVRPAKILLSASTRN